MLANMEGKDLCRPTPRQPGKHEAWQMPQGGIDDGERIRKKPQLRELC